MRISLVCTKLLGSHKSEWGLYEAAAQFGVDAKSEKCIKCPATFVGEYAEQDAALYVYVSMGSASRRNN